MAIDTTGKFWRGEGFTDLAEYLREFKPGGYLVARIKQAVCQQCDGKTFGVLADDEEGCAQTAHLLIDAI
ncbi:MAG TPA: hypothetical protein VFX60_19810 [Micromonospora sp.]|nr:hypothetical protein [Micromonospora sp.]